MKTTVLFLLGLLGCNSVFATTYYVNSITGSDGNPGTQAAPFQTFYKVTQITINPGDTIRFAAGTGYSGYFEFIQSGTAAQPITITSYGTGNPPEFSNENEWYAIRLTGNHLVLDGVKIRNTHESGAVIWGDNCVIQNCEITDTGIGITLDGAQNCRVTGNYIHNLHMVNNTDDNGDNDHGASGINLVGVMTGVDIGWNRLSHCIAPSYDYGVDGGAFEFYGTLSNIEIHHNWCDSNNGVFEIGGGTASNVRISYNLCESNGLLGGFHFQGTYAASIFNFRFENNTVAETASGFPYVIWFNGSGTESQFSLTNNIFSFFGFTLFTNNPGFARGYNLYWGSSIGYTPGATEMIADPKFENPGAGDYRLQPTSAAINAGTNLGYTHDRLANPIVNAPDLGAYESPY